MASKLKIVEEVRDIVPASQVPKFDPAPPASATPAGLPGGSACSSSISRAVASAMPAGLSAPPPVLPTALRNKAGPESFARAWDAVLRLPVNRRRYCEHSRRLEPFGVHRD